MCAKSGATHSFNPKHIAFIRDTGSERRNLPAKVPKTASTAWIPGTVAIATSGDIAIAASTSIVLLGLTTNTVATTDSDYAATTALPVEMLEQQAVYICPIEAGGSLTQANVGNYYDLNSTTGTGLNLGGTTYKQCKIVGVIDAATAYVTFNPSVL